jgi:hypothetical protein
MTQTIFATVEDIKKTHSKTKPRSVYSYSSHTRDFNCVQPKESPFLDGGKPISNKELPEAFGNIAASKHYSLTGVHITPSRMDRYYDFHRYYQSNNQIDGVPESSNYKELLSKPYFVLITRNEYRSDYYKSEHQGFPFEGSDKWKEIAATAKNPVYIHNDEYRSSGYRFDRHSHNSEGVCNANVVVEIQFNGQDCLLAVPFEFAEYAFGLQITEDLNLRLNNGQEGPFSGYFSENFAFTLETLTSMCQLIGMNHQNSKVFLKHAFAKNMSELPLDGIRKTYLKLVPIMNEVLDDNPIAICAYRSFISYSKKSVDGVKISSIFNEVFEKVSDKKQFVDALKIFYKFDKSTSPSGFSGSFYTFCEKLKNLDIFKVRRKAVIKSQAGRAMTKIMDDADSLTIDKKKHKLTWAQIESGNLPLGTFFKKSEQYYILNDNWDLWEEMFKRGYGEQAIELANEVKGRTTYEKDLMSYFYFVLYSLPKYLKKHTGQKWTCVPKLVSSSEELEPPKEEGGISRSRSALTPVADNETHTVVVPYASLAIYGGRGTTYCYSHDYHVLHDGLSFEGCAVSKEVEEKLNGRDDYGLMFYTLTGSAQGRGYPTFLIIFERRESHNDTRVHFHRSHPSRSKDGDCNPIHNWIRTNFNWIMGNVNAKLLKAQQGDLYFVDASDQKNLSFSHKVNKYDNHCFEEAVDFAEYLKSAKSNILGYVKLEKDTWLTHNEHDNVLIPTGIYAIHQCRSWEANPKGVWSLRID